MRFIEVRQLPRLGDTKAIEEARKEILALHADEVARSNFIDNNADKYGYLRSALWQLGSMKCWYSEAKLQYQAGHVEHFRPKKKVAKVEHCGYWWDAFDWTNLRLAHPTVNVRVTDYQSGKVVGKGTYFPLRDESKRAVDKVTEANEEPVLLDPTVPQDCRLLSFELSSGRPTPSVKKEDDEWRFLRADLSIDFYHLDEGTWNVARKDLIDEMVVLCDALIAAKTAIPHDAEVYEELLSTLVERTNHLAEFSSVAIQVAREKGVWI